MEPRAEQQHADAVSCPHVGCKASTSAAYVCACLNCSPGRNRLVLAAFLDYCCEPDNTAAHTTAAAAAADAPAAGVLAAAAAQRSSSRSSKSNRSSSSKLKLKQHDSEDEEEVEPAMDLSMAGKRAVRKAIGFAVDIEHAEALNSLFLQAGGLHPCLHHVHAAVS